MPVVAVEGPDTGWRMALRRGLPATIRVRACRDPDAVVALPGGSGTLDELLEAISLKRLGSFTGPIVMVNTGRFCDACLEMLERCIQPRFLLPRHRQMWRCE